MDTNKAKDFLIEQTAQQAAMEGVSLSDLEKRMMYFTESSGAPEDPIALNDEFEAQYDTAEYEPKISRLLHHAYARLKKDNPLLVRQWDDSLRFLAKGDHYILVLWRSDYPRGRSLYDSLKLLGASVVLVVLALGFVVLSDHYGWVEMEHSPKTYSSPPSWLKPAFWTLAIGAYIYLVILPRVLKRQPTSIRALVRKLLGR